MTMASTLRVVLSVNQLSAISAGTYISWDLTPQLITKTYPYQVQIRASLEQLLVETRWDRGTGVPRS